MDKSGFFYGHNKNNCSSCQFLKIGSTSWMTDQYMEVLTKATFDLRGIINGNANKQK